MKHLSMSRIALVIRFVHMPTLGPVSRRSLLATVPAAALAFAAPQRNLLPVGLELYSVRQDLAKDPKATVTAVAKMGYQVVEFYSPYFSWTLDQAREMKQLMDGLGVRCHSTHNSPEAFTGEGIRKAIDL